MFQVTRRRFGEMTLALAAQARRLGAGTGIDETLRVSAARRKIPAVAAMAATEEKILWSGAFGSRDSTSRIGVRPDSVFSIASMTKAITSIAALQLVEQGKVALHGPAAKYLPELGKLDVIDGFDSQGNPILRPSGKPVTLHHLLTHTSGFAYDIWDETMLRYNTLIRERSPAAVSPITPLIFEPGTRWQYGTSTDWVGRIVEAVSGMTLEQYFQRNILQPLGMKDTSYICAPEQFERLVSTYRRQTDGSLTEDPRTLPAVPTAFNGGGGLYSTCADYVKFMQMILRRGKSANKDQILQAKTVDMMSSNQIGGLGAGKLKSARPTISSDVDLHAGFADKWGYGFLINTAAYAGGRSAGSLAWAGIANTFYWIDPKRSLCAVIMMQFFPFVDSQAVGLLSDFEKGLYAG